MSGASLNLFVSYSLSGFIGTFSDVLPGTAEPMTLDDVRRIERTLSEKHPRAPDEDEDRFRASIIWWCVRAAGA